MEKIKYILIQNKNEDLKCIQEKVETIIKNKFDLCPYFESEIIPFKKNEEKNYFSGFKSKHFFILTNETMGDMKSENYKYINGLFILFYKGKLTAEVVTRARKTNALGIFNLDRFYGEYLEFSEIARFEESFKKISRNILNEEVLEKNVYKEINWKVDLENEDDKEKILSLYSDEKMQSVLRKTNKIIQKVSPYYKEIIKHTDAKNINQLKKLENTILGEENLKNIPGILEKINTKTKNLEYKKIQGILITGASGTGKTLLAEYIKDELKSSTENHSRLSKVPLVNLSDNLISSELFGSYPGAFTGSSYKMGKLLSNSGGIVFLDEIGDVSMDVQTKLLTFMDDMRIIVEGYSNTEGIKIPLLLIAATNKNLKKKCKVTTSEMIYTIDFSIE